MRNLLLGFLFSVCVSAGAYESTPRSIPLGKFGALEIQAPVAWKDSVETPPNGIPTALKLVPKNGARFEVVVVPYTPDIAGGRAATMDELRRFTREIANSAASRAVERPIELKELHGASNGGYYFSMTDKEFGKVPKPDDYKYMIQGALAVGQLRVMFVILTNDGQESIVKEALAMVSAAVHR